MSWKTSPESFCSRKKKSGNKNGENQKCLFGKKAWIQNQEIEKLRLLVFLRSSSSYVLCLTACRDSKFVPWVLCSHQDTFWVMQPKREKQVDLSFSLILMGAAMCLWILSALLDRNALMPVGRAAGSRCECLQSCCSKGRFFHSQEMLHSFFPLKLCNFYNLNLMLLNEMLRERLFAVSFGCIVLFCCTTQY